MADWLLSLPVAWMSLIILAAVYGVTAVIYILVTTSAVGDRTRAFKAISPGMLPPLAIIFALLVGFLAAQVWSDHDRATTAVNHEASALRAAVILSAAFRGESEHALKDLVRRHIQQAVADEWPAISRRDATVTLVPATLANALQMAVTLNPSAMARWRRNAR